jgi:hypothetical protein
MFKKGSENRWSDKIFEVENANGKTVELTDGTTHKRNKVLLVPHDTKPIITQKNVIKLATKLHKDKQLFKRENIKESDVIAGGRAARAGRGELKTNKYLE